MAEAAASIAGLASLAIQLTQSVDTLRRFYRSVRNAPETLEHLVLELETVSLALKEVERDRLTSNMEARADLLSLCLQTCERGAKRLQQVVDKMQRLQTKFKGLGLAYVAIKEKDEQALLTDLERAKSSLALAYQIYTEAIRQADVRYQSLSIQQISQQLAILPTEVVVHLQSSSKPTTNLVTCIVGTDFTASRPKSAEASDADAVDTYDAMTAARSSHHKKWKHLRIPLRFCQQIWHFSAARSTGGWEFKIEVDRIRPDDAPIFGLVERDDLAGVQRLFALGEASSWDCDRSGESLLYTASLYDAPQVVRFLLDQRHHAEFPRFWNYAVDMDYSPVRLNHFERLKVISMPCRRDEMFRFCLEQGHIEPLSFFDSELHDRQHGLISCASLENVSLLLQHMPIPLSRVSFESRFHCAMGMDPGTASPASLLKISGLKDVNPVLASAKTRRGQTALYIAVKALNDRWCNNLGQHDWADFARSLVENGANVHARREVMGGDWWTPLLELILNNYKNSLDILLSKLQSWLKWLASAGIDLVEYGVFESRNIKDRRDTRYRMLQIGDKHSLLDLYYGPTPESWSLTLRPFGEVPVYKEFSMPGAWKDERIPNTICWEPDDDERYSGRWKPHPCGCRQSDPRHNRDHVHVMFGPPQDIRQLIELEAPSGFEKLVAGCQDDHGVVSLLVLRSRTGSSRRKRSASQPPPLRRRERAYCAQGRWAHHGPKLSDYHSLYHLCPSDGKHRYGCPRDGSYGLKVVDLRACLASWHSMGASDFEKGPAQIILRENDSWVDS